MTHELRFDPNEHRYWIGDMELHGVTSIMQRLGLVNFHAPWYTDEARDRGVVLHACCSLAIFQNYNYQF